MTIRAFRLGGVSVVAGTICMSIAIFGGRSLTVSALRRVDNMSDEKDCLFMLITFYYMTKLHFSTPLKYYIFLQLSHQMLESA